LIPLTADKTDEPLEAGSDSLKHDEPLSSPDQQPVIPFI
jgi:hypothetical protein